MNSLKNILKTFYECTRLPIYVFDEHFEIIESYNNVGKLDNFFIPNRDILINTNENNLYFYKEKKYILIPYTFNLKLIYFLIGPFSRTNENDLPIVNNSSIKYIEKLLINILRDVEAENYHPCVAKGIEYIHKNYSSPITIDNVCRSLNINKCYFCNLFKKETGYTFINFLNLMRIERSKLLIEKSKLPLTEVALKVGFSTSCYFSTIFKKVTGTTPSEFKALLNK